jgi:phosphinothricin acetyltransferase
LVPASGALYLSLFAMDFSIRPADPADLPAITAIYGEAVRTGTASFEIDPPDEAEMARRFMTLAEGGYPYFVAEAGSRVAGYAYAGPYRPRPGYRHTVEDSVYLAPEAWGHGIGSALLKRLIAESEARSFRQMIAVIGDSANHASVRLHERHAFRHVGILESAGFKHGRWRDCVLMQRALGPGDAAPPSR